MNRKVAFASVALSGALGLLISALVVFVFFPTDRIGESFPELGDKLPYGGSAYLTTFAIWVVVTAVATVGGLLLVRARFRSTNVRAYSPRRVLEGCLLSFGASTGLTLIFAVLVDVGMYSMNPDAGSNAWGFPIWILTLAGCAAIFVLIGMRIFDHTKLALPGP